MDILCFRPQAPAISRIRPLFSNSVAGGTAILGTERNGEDLPPNDTKIRQKLSSLLKDPGRISGETQLLDPPESIRGPILGAANRRSGRVCPFLRLFDSTVPCREPTRPSFSGSSYYVAPAFGRGGNSQEGANGQRTVCQQSAPNFRHAHRMRRLFDCRSRKTGGETAEGAQRQFTKAPGATLRGKSGKNRGNCEETTRIYPGRPPFRISRLQGSRKVRRNRPPFLEAGGGQGERLASLCLFTRRQNAGRRLFPLIVSCKMRGVL